MTSVVLCTIRTFTPLLFGFVIGSLISLAIFPSVQHGNDGDLQNDYQTNCFANSGSGENRIDDLENPADRFNQEEKSEDLEVVVHRQSPEKSEKNQLSKKPKVVRPRFYATELGLKDKLFIGVLTTKTTLNTLAVAMNRTMSHHVSRIVFFVEGPHSEIVSGPLNLIGFAHMKKHLKPFYLLEYISKQVLNNYDWFFIVPDSTYVKGFKLYELVTHMSVGHKILMGKKSKENPNWCQLEAGILLSQDVMQAVVGAVSSCRRNSDPNLPASVNLGNCIEQAAKISCSEDWNGKSFKSWQLDPETDLETSISSVLSKQDTFNSAVTVFPLQSPADFHWLHKYYCQLELEQISLLTASTQEGIHNLSLETPDGPSWPPGLPRPWSPANRYEMFWWDYFTESHIFTDHTTENVRKLAGIHKKDVTSVVEFSRHYLADKVPKGYKFDRLLNGYRRFDPTRGMDYVLDLVYRSSTQKTSSEIFRRVHLVRPLSRVELVPVPYVTETTEVLIILPVKADELVATRKFLSRYVKIFLEASDNNRLILVLSNLISNSSAFLLWQDVSLVLKQYYSSRKADNSLIETVRFPGDSENPYDVMDSVISIFGNDPLYLLVNPYVEMDIDFMNRVRMNTIRANQVFFPIPFAEFNPKITATVLSHQKNSLRDQEIQQNSPPRKTKSRSAVHPGAETLEIHKHLGHFDEHDFTVASFYGSDYSEFRSKKRTENSQNDNRKGRNLVQNNVVSIYLGVPTMHVMRAIDPDLKVRYSEKVCNPRLEEGDYSHCIASKKEGLASKAQLAYLVLEQTEKLSRAAGNTTSLNSRAMNHHY